MQDYSLTALFNYMVNQKFNWYTKRIIPANLNLTGRTKLENSNLFNLQFVRLMNTTIPFYNFPPYKDLFSFWKKSSKAVLNDLFF